MNSTLGVDSKTRLNPVFKYSRLFYNENLAFKPASIITLLIFSLIIYWPVFFNQFQTLWDDLWVVQNNYTEDGFTFENIWKILSQFFHGQYAPINELYYVTIYWVMGYNPFWFHLSGLLVHICNILLVYYLILTILGRYSSLHPVSIQRIAFLTAILFTVQPVLVESVAWISASKIIIYTFFYLIAIHLYLYFILKKNWKYYLLTILFFIISFGAKEQAVTMPCCLLLLDYIAGRDLKTKQVWIEKIPLFLLSLFFGYITFLSQAANGEGVLSEHEKYPIYQNVLFASFSLTEYATKCILPIKLSYIYPFPNLPNEAVPARFWLYPFIILFAIIGLWNFWKQKWILFGVVFFVIHIGVTLNLISTARFAMLADRYVYLSSIGIFFLIAYFINWTILSKSKYTSSILMASILYILSLSIYSFNRVKVWQNSDTLKKEMREILKNRDDNKTSNN